MKTPINSIDMLPPIVTFFSSHYEIGFSFPLAVGIFANGRSNSFLIKPRELWKRLDYDPQYSLDKPIEFFEQYGLEIEIIQKLLAKLLKGSEFTLYLRDDYDPRFFDMLGLEQLQIRDIDVIDKFENYDTRYAEMIRRMQEEKLNLYSIEDVVATIAEQTFDNLKYEDLNDLLAVCRKQIQI
jgi:hypothetical protein